MNDIIQRESILLEDIRDLIHEAKTKIAIRVNSQMTLLYWHIGRRIRDEIIGDSRAEYGKQVIKFLATDLSAEYGNGFSKTSLSKMIQFYDIFLNFQIIPTLSEQLTWSHIVELLPLRSREQQEYYAYMTIEARWSVRERRSSINRMTFDRTIANQKANIVKITSDNFANISNNEIFHLREIKHIWRNKTDVVYQAF